MLDCGMCLDYGQMVLDNEFIKMYRHILEGFPINDETLALDTIHKVGPRGHFLMEEHTLKHMNEQSASEFFDRGPRDEWLANGRPSKNDLAREKAEQLLAEHKVVPLAPGVEEKFDEIIKEADKRYCKK